MLTILEHNTRLIDLLKRAVPIVNRPIVTARRRAMATSIDSVVATGCYEQSVRLTFAIYDLWCIVYEPHDNYSNPEQRAVAEGFHDVISHDYLKEIKPYANF